MKTKVLNAVLLNSVLLNFNWCKHLHNNNVQFTFVNAHHLITSGWFGIIWNSATDNSKCISAHYVFARLSPITASLRWPVISLTVRLQQYSKVAAVALSLSDSIGNPLYLPLYTFYLPYVIKYLFQWVVQWS